MISEKFLARSQLIEDDILLSCDSADEDFLQSSSSGQDINFQVTSPHTSPSVSGTSPGKAHMAVECEHCGKVLSRRQNLRLHLMHVHSLNVEDATNVAASACGPSPGKSPMRKVLKKVTLEEYGKNESGSGGKSAKKNMCNICGQTFCSNSNIARHKRRVHGFVSGMMKQKTSVSLAGNLEMSSDSSESSEEEEEEVVKEQGNDTTTGSISISTCSIDQDTNSDDSWCLPKLQQQGTFKVLGEDGTSEVTVSPSKSKLGKSFKIQLLGGKSTLLGDEQTEADKTEEPLFEYRETQCRFCDESFNSKSSRYRHEKELCAVGRLKKKGS